MDWKTKTTDSDNSREKAIVGYDSFFCHACLVDKPLDDLSPDPRYCQGCCDFLLKEARMLPDGKRPRWVPKIQSEKEFKGKNSVEKSIQVSKDVVLKMSTVNSKKFEVDIFHPLVGKVTRKKRGPKQRQLPEDIIRQWADEGIGSKAIASKLRNELGVKVSYKTVQRVLSGEREFDKHGDNKFT